MIRNTTKHGILSIVGMGLLTVAVAGSSTAFAHTPRDGGIGGGAFFGEPRMLRALDLTADQTKAVRGILLAHGSTLRQLAAEERAARRAIGDKLVGPGSLTEQDVDGLVEHELQTRSALERERLATALAVRGQLTPAQIDEVASIREGVSHIRPRMHRLVADPLATE